MKSLKYILVTIAVVVVIGLQSCQNAEGNSTGSEFMPDMAHSVAYESNYYNYYYNNTWGSQDEYYAYAQPKKPVNGTVARGFAGVSNPATIEGMKVLAEAKGMLSPSQISIKPNGSVPYYYADSEEGRASAIAELVNNPYPITDAGLAKGKELYEVFCGICHGEKGDGAGYLVRDDGGVYPAQPANFLLEEHVNATNGRYYHSIMYGRNLMGAYKDKLSYEERWQVIHYIRSLQAKELKKEYNQLVNTLNAVDKPAGAAGLPKLVDAFYLQSASKPMMHSSSEAHSHNDHGHSDNHHEDHSSH